MLNSASIWMNSNLYLEHWWQNTVMHFGLTIVEHWFYLAIHRCVYVWASFCELNTPNKNPLCKWALAHIIHNNNDELFCQGHLSFCTQSFKITKLFFLLKKDERRNPTSTHKTNGHNNSEKRYFIFKNDFSMKISTRMVLNCDNRHHIRHIINHSKVSVSDF